MTLMFIGAIAMSCFIASLFFLRFWKKTQDRFFLFFSLSFMIEGINRIVAGLLFDVTDEYQPFIYLMRLVAFLIILIAILDKNRKMAQ